MKGQRDLRNLPCPSSPCQPHHGVREWLGKSPVGLFLLGRMRPHLGARGHGTSALGEWDVPCLGTGESVADLVLLLLLEPPKQLQGFPHAAGAEEDGWKQGDKKYNRSGVSVEHNAWGHIAMGNNP